MKKISRKLLGVILFLAAPMCLTSCFGDNSNSSNSGSSNNNNSGSSERVYLTSVSISANRTSFVTGENIVITPSITPNNANYYDDSSYKESFFEHFYEKDGGEAVQFKKNSFAGSFTFEEPGNYVFWSKYCNHNFHSGTSGDLVSNRIEVSVDLPESEKVMFKYKVLDDGTAELYAGPLLKDVENVVIPAEIDNYEISLISNSGFEGLKKMKTLRFSPDLKSNFSIGNYAFKDCSSLKRVQLGWQIKTIGKGAFTNNDPDLRIFIEDSVLSSNFYYNYSGATNNWNSSNYSYYLNMKDFADDSDYLYGLNNNDTYEIIQYYGRDINLEIPSGFNEKNITHIEHNAYANDSFIKTIKFPEHLLYIGTSAFSGCSQVKEIRFPQELEKIDNSAFKGCTSLHYVQIPLSVNSIGKSVFTNNYADLRIYCAVNSRPSGFYFNYSGASDNWNSGCAYTYYSAHDYLIDGDFVYSVLSDNTLGVSEYNGREINLVIPEKVNNMNVSCIHLETFLNKNFLQVVTLPSTLKKIESSAFKGCISLKSIKLPSGLTMLGDSVFSGCVALTSLVIPLSVKDIGKSCFYGCSNLELFVESANRPSGFYFNYSGASNNWNSGVKMTYWGAGNGWFYDGEGDPYHL